MIDPKLVSRYHDAGCIVVREKLLSGQNRGLRCTMKIRCRLGVTSRADLQPISD